MHMDRPATEALGGAALELNGIARRFGRRWVLRGIDLQIPAGQVVAVTGRNGSGKTTLLRIACTALRPTRGRASIFGHDLVDEAARIRALVGAMAHQPGLYEDLTAAENLIFSLRMAGRTVVASDIDAALENVGLLAERNERVRGFSAGMRRRVALARLLLRPPSLLLLDEPYASFDEDGIGRVNELARAVADGGGAALVATHDIARARLVMDRHVHIENGRILERIAGDGLVDGVPSPTPLRSLQGGG